MTIWIDNRTEKTFSAELEQALKIAVETTLVYEGFQKPCEVSVSIVNNEEIRQINGQFRQMDKATDVLSFPLLTFSQGEREDLNEKGEVLLGDIILSLERAEEQAKEYGHSLKREVAFLTVHSMLHLLGYDHMEEAEEGDMILRQKEILEIAKIPRE